MKKLFVMTFLGLSMVVLAQHVTPLSIQVAEINLDSLRTAYLAQPLMYRASLDVVAEQLEENEKQIKMAKEELKTEMKHSKEMNKALEEGLKMAASLKKDYTQEEGELLSMRKVFEEQQKNINKPNRLNQQTKDAYIKVLEQQQELIEQSLTEITQRMQAVTKMEEILRTAQLDGQLYEQEIEKKAFDLAQIEALYKARKDTLKSERKSAKNIQ